MQLNSTLARIIPTLMQGEKRSLSSQSTLRLMSFTLRFIKWTIVFIALYERDFLYRFSAIMTPLKLRCRICIGDSKRRKKEFPNILILKKEKLRSFEAEAARLNNSFNKP